MKKFVLILLALMMVFTLVSCAKPEAETVTEAETTEEEVTEVEEAAEEEEEVAEAEEPEEVVSEEVEPVKGGYLNISGGNQTTNMFHQVRATQAIAFQWMFQETLMKYDKSGVPQPFLLESIEGDNETKIWTMKIRQGVKFHDGSDLNADVVVWNIDTYKEKGIFADSFWSDVEDATAVDEYTVEVKMSKWDSLFPYTLARTMPIASKQSWDEFGEEYYEEHPVGTGPFILDKWERDVSMDIVAFPDYWGGTPLLEGIKAVVYNEALVMQAAMRAGELDIMSTNDYAIARQMEEEGFRVTPASVPTTAYTLCFETDDPEDPFYNEDVRRAVAYAINVDEVIDSVFFGYGIKSPQWGTPSSEFFSPDVTGHPYDPEKAKELLSNAGYPNGFKTKLSTAAGAQFADISLIIIEQLAQVGIEVELNQVEGAAFVQYIGDWEEGMFLHPMGQENGAASQLASTFKEGVTFALGIGAFDHPTDLYEKVREALDASPDEVAGLFQEIQKIVFEDRVYMKTIAIGPYIGIERTQVNDLRFCDDQWLSGDWHLAWKEAD